MLTERFKLLIDKYLDESIMPDEKQQLITLLQDKAYLKLLEEIVTGELSERVYDMQLGERSNKVITEYFDQILASESRSAVAVSSDQQPSHSLQSNFNQQFIPRLLAGKFISGNKRWLSYAAAILIIFGIGTAVVVSLTNNSKEEQTLANGNKQLQTDILPGGNKALLTLSDGTIITLDSAANGAIAQQGNAAIVKLANGQIAYNLNGVAEGEVMMNRMRTPRGGQYQLTLPDGTKVWLNAASSITYPAVFVGKERNVKITGEAYFEIVSNKAKPFIVDVDGKSSVEVLGTSFNVNAYENERAIKTTLLSGSVKIKSATAVVLSSDQQSKAQKLTTVILKPGQQAVLVSSDRQVEGEQLRIINNADIGEVMAWKNGLFNFNGADFQVVMRQLERWYNIQVKYEGSVPDIIFKGKIYRNVNLSDLLEGFGKMGAKFRLEGKTLIVAK